MKSFNPEPMNVSSMNVIEVQGLTKRYGDVLAVDGISFAAPAGATVGLLGGLTVFDNQLSTQVLRKSTSTGQRLIRFTKTVAQTGSTGLTTAGTVTTDMITGRLSWRQINNYQDLHTAP